MDRFVILHHTAGPQLHRTSHAHFDWMFERDGVLMTFATDVIDSLLDPTRGPGMQTSFEFPARRLADHRLAYLDFEGEISGQRGEVRRVFAGRYRCQTESEEGFVATLNGVGSAGSQQEAIECRGELTVYRNRRVGPRLSDNRDEWRLRWAPF